MTDLVNRSVTTCAVTRDTAGVQSVRGLLLSDRDKGGVDVFCLEAASQPDIMLLHKFIWGPKIAHTADA